MATTNPQTSQYRTLLIVIGVAAVIAAIIAVLLLTRGGAAPGEPQIGARPPDAITRLGRGSLTRVTFSESGDLFALTGNVGVYIHDADTREELWSVATVEPVLTAGFSSDDRLLAVGLKDGTTLLLDAHTGDALNSFAGPERVTAVTWATTDDDRRLLIIGYNSGALAATDITGDPGSLNSSNVQRFADDTSGVTTASVSPNQGFLATGNRNGVVTLWDLTFNVPIAVLQEHEANNAVLSVDWTPEGTEILSSSRDGTVIVWDVATLQARVTLSEHEGEVVNVYAGPTQDAFTSFSDDGSLIQWALPEGDVEVVNQALPPLLAAAASPRDGSAVIISEQGGVFILNADDGQIQPLAGYPDRDVLAGPIAWSPDGEQIAAGRGTSIVLWDVETSAPVMRLEGETATITALAWSNGGTRLAAGDREGGLHIWTPARGRVRTAPTQHPDEVAAIAWGPSGRRIATAGGLDGSVRVWHPSTGELLQTLTVGEGGVFSLAWSPDGSMLAAGTLQGRTYVFDASEELIDDEPFARVAGHISWITSLAFSPDNALMATGSADTRITIWDTVTFEPLQVLAGHSAAVRDVAFSPDSTQVASGSLDKLIVIWNICEGGCPDDIDQAFGGHSEGAIVVEWAPDGQALASSSDDGTNIIWAVEP